MQIIKFVIVFFYVVFSLDIEVKHADKSDILESVHLNWYAPFFSGGGYCSEAMSFMFAAHAIDFKNFTVIQHGDSVNRQFISSLSTREALMMAVYKDQNVKSSRKAKLLVNVCHSEPGAWYVPFPKYYTSQCPPVATQHSHFNIGRTMFETDRLPHGWIDRLRYLDEIWVPTEFAREIFIAGGLSAKKIRVVAEPVDCDFFKPFESIIVESNTLIARSLLEDGNDKHLRLLLELYERRASIFLFVGKFEGRKGIDLLLRAYFDAFSSDRFSGTDVMLAIVTSSYHSSADFETQITSTLSELQAAHPSRQIPPHVILSALHQDLMPVLYNLASALVSSDI
jgi:glycosyltransferase involved in cell wall biosynthesis